ncbi:hypothetical protein BDFB_014196, partial [Asbolus verrucosus]
LTRALANNEAALQQFINGNNLFTASLYKRQSSHLLSLDVKTKLLKKFVIACTFLIIMIMWKLVLKNHFLCCKAITFTPFALPIKCMLRKIFPLNKVSNDLPLKFTALI